VKREDVFVTTKVPPTELEPTNFARCVENSLTSLRLDFVDLLLIHWPNPAVPMRDVIKALCEAKRRGYARHIGVSNFTVALLDEAMALTSEPLVTNQIELHPFIDQNKIVAACKKHGMTVTAYAPLARGKGFDNGTLRTVAEAQNRDVAQVMLRYIIQQGFIAIPQSDSREHIDANLQVLDFTLPAADMNKLASLKTAGIRVVNSAFAPVWD
jgi:2,5-diketo-D-gluconate reductase B